MRLIPALALLVTGFLASDCAHAADTRPFDVRDLVAFDRLSEPAVSPDGKLLVFTVSSLDLEANKRRADLWLVGTDGAGLRH